MNSQHVADDGQKQDGYWALVDHAAIAIFRTERGGRFTWVNPALVTMLGYTDRRAVLALDLDREVFHDSGQRRQLIAQHGEDGFVTGVEVRWMRADGKRITVLLSGRVVKGTAGAVVGFEGTAVDLTERRSLEQQLRQAQKMEIVGQLTGGVAHDFNNLLTVILANAEDLAADPDDKGPTRERLLDVVEAAKRGRSLVRKLLHVGRAVPLEKRPVNLGTVVRDIRRFLTRLLPENITIEVAIDGAVPTVLADPGCIDQILLNLATNARDAMPGGGRLTITLGTVWVKGRLPDRPWVEPGEYLCLLVSDTGVGMTEQTRGRIFEPFFTTKPSSKGSGLGLAMVYGLTRQHGGFVDVESEPGHGTTIEVCLPVARDTAATVEVSDPATATPEARGTATLLLVEDEPGIRRVTRRLLKGRGYRVFEAADGQAALDRYRAEWRSIDLVVSDLVMPRLCGRELLDALRAVNPAVRVLFVSGYSSAESQDCTGLDADVPFLQKPWTLSELLSAICAALPAG